MPIDKYIHDDAGTLTERELNDVSAGAADAGKGVALDSTGKIDLTMMPVGIGPDVSVLEVTDSVAAGDFVSIWQETGVAKARLADASSIGKQADGFVESAFTAGQVATIFHTGINGNLAALDQGVEYYLSTTPGKVTDVVPQAPGNSVQRIGKSISATELVYEAAQPIIKA